MSENFLKEELTGNQKKLVEARKEKRLLNFLIDYFAFIVFTTLFYEMVNGLGYSVNFSEDGIQERIQILIFYFTYYMLFEGMNGGKTLGKMITKTRVVTLEGKEPEVSDILNRSFIRLIPFEQFSYLTSQLSGWHDRWSKTMVIEE